MSKKVNPIKMMRNNLEDILLPGEKLYPVDTTTQEGHILQGYYWISNYSRLISSYGNIWRVVKSFDNTGGYQHVVLRSIDGKSVNALNHRLLMGAITDDMEYFHSHEVDHIGGDKTNNNENSLELVDHDINVQRAYDNGLKKSITDDQIQDIIKRSRDALPNVIDKELAEEYGVKENTIKYIRLGRDKYKERLKTLGLEPVKKKEFNISDDQIRYIMESVKNAFPENIDEKLASDLGLSRDTIIDIRTGCNKYGDKLKAFGIAPIKYQKGLSDWRICKIFDLVEQGKSDKEIAEELNISKSTVISIRTGNGQYKEKINSLGLSSKNRRVSALTESQIRYIMEQSIAAYPEKIDKILSDELGISEYTVMHVRSGLYEYGAIISKLGYSPILYSAKTTNKITDDIIKEVIKMAKLGYSDNEIAKKVDRAPATIRNIRTGNVAYIDRMKALNLEPVAKFQ